MSAGSSQTQTIQGNIVRYIHTYQQYDEIFEFNKSFLCIYFQSEDEALARAIAISIMELDETNDRNRRNEAADAQRRNNNTTVPVGGQQQTSGKDKCSLS